VYQYDIVSSQSPTEQQGVIRTGGSAEVTYFMRNSGYLPVLVFLEPASPGVDIPPDRTRTYVPGQSTVNASVTLHAPEETGIYPRFVREHRYLVVMPPSLITALHRLHPFVALVGINLFVASVVVVVGVTSIGTGRVRLRSRERDITFREELSRRLPALGGGRSGPKSPSRSAAPPSPSGTGPSLPSDATSRRDRSRPPASTPDGADGEAGGADSGRAATPDRLTDRQRRAVEETLARPPADAGLDAARWTPDVLRTYLHRTYGVEYSELRCVWLLERADVDPRTGRPAGDRPTSAEGG